MLSRLEPYSLVRDCIHDGDILLFRRRCWMPHSYLIGQAGWSIYSHAGMAAWWPDAEGSKGSLFCLEMLQFRGGRAVLLSNRVEQCPERIDVYSPNRLYLISKWGDESADRIPGEAVGAMKRLTGTPYGWLSLARIGLLHTPIVRWVVPAPIDDRANGTHAPFCSQAIARAYRTAGVDVVPNLSDWATEPGHLARSLLFGSGYRFTLKR